MPTEVVKPVLSPIFDRTARGSPLVAHAGPRQRREGGDRQELPDRNAYANAADERNADSFRIAGGYADANTGSHRDAAGSPTPEATPTPTPAPTASPEPTVEPTPSPTPIDPVAGDVDCDGDVDAVDALLILKTVAGLPVELPPGCPAIGS